ncbi:hypothetical protein CIHG_10257 [Coccidioides immitis H538.4]|uniref:Uncharacterized protein n=1 Tax=Coccidioides immitis H538.4 TaxID=396776 RepID=A0A0J8S5I5_COCIT|nr:hypothetical protein CIHG_10257 [Coccidioides immitis H538.4]
MNGIKNKWKDLENHKKDVNLLKELRIKNSHTDLHETTIIFNQQVSLHCRKTVETITKMWEDSQHEKYGVTAHPDLQFHSSLQHTCDNHRSAVVCKLFLATVASQRL